MAHRSRSSAVGAPSSSSALPPRPLPEPDALLRGVALWLRRRRRAGLRELRRALEFALPLTLGLLPGLLPALSAPALPRRGETGGGTLRLRLRAARLRAGEPERPRPPPRVGDLLRGGRSRECLRATRRSGELARRPASAGRRPRSLSARRGDSARDRWRRGGVDCLRGGDGSLRGGAGDARCEPRRRPSAAAGLRGERRRARASTGEGLRAPRRRSAVGERRRACASARAPRSPSRRSSASRERRLAGAGASLRRSREGDLRRLDGLPRKVPPWAMCVMWGRGATGRRVAAAAAERAWRGTFCHAAARCACLATRAGAGPWAGTGCGAP